MLEDQRRNCQRKTCRTQLDCIDHKSVFLRRVAFIEKSRTNKTHHTNECYQHTACCVNVLIPIEPGSHHKNDASKAQYQSKYAPPRQPFTQNKWRDERQE